jgi:hypothetical protein
MGPVACFGQHTSSHGRSGAQSQCSILYVHVSKTAHYFPGRLALIIGTMVVFVEVIVLLRALTSPCGALSSLP